MRLSCPEHGVNLLGSVVCNGATSPWISQGFGFCSFKDELGKCHLKNEELRTLV